MGTGCARVNLGTAAVTRPEWAEAAIRAYGDRIAIALDVRQGALATHGWVKAAGSVLPLVTRFSAAGCARFVVTDTTVDGTLTGPNLGLLTQVATLTKADVVASGGIGRLDDIRALKALEGLGLGGVIIGTALYEHKFTLAEALALAAAD